mgnify:CR=1 FL=1|jgi:uncharacterized protein with GYD domain
MSTTSLDHVSTEQARTIRDSAERLALKALREEGESSPKVAAAWMVFRAYDLVVKSREVVGCK